MSARRIGLLLLAVTLGVPGSVHAAEPTPGGDALDCGTVSLYHLLSLTGHPTDLDGLRSSLGPAGAEGHSFRELRAAAGHRGLGLNAVVLPKRRSAIQGPTLLFVKMGRKGHFLVVRPVGHTGHLVQVLDGDHPPAVVDAERIFASPSWTGLALVPHRRNPLALAGAGLAIACVAALVARSWARMRGRAAPDDRAGVPGPAAG